MSRIVVRNLGTTPVTIDRAGHQLGAGEYGVASDTDHVTDAALAAGKIGEVARPDGSGGIDPAAAAAFELLDAKDSGDSAQVAGATADLSAGNDGQPVNLEQPDGGSAAEPAPAKTTSAREKGRR